ncbi:hypothetical protein NMG60_11026983, partial [Bertholletia excelsa]
IDDKVAKVLELVKNKTEGRKRGDTSTKDSELVELIVDFHRQYKILHELYDNLRGEVQEQVQCKDKERCSSASSSDSESFFSVDGASARSSPRNDILQTFRDDIKQKNEISFLEATDLRSRLTSLNEEKEALYLEYMASLSKIQKSEKIIQDLKTEASQTGGINQKLMKECTQLKEILSDREKELLSLTKANQSHDSIVPAQIKELERQISSLRPDQKNLCNQKRELEERIEGLALEAKQLGEENSGLRAHVQNFRMEVDGLQNQKRKLEEQLLDKSKEASAEVNCVLDQVNVLQEKLQSLSGKNSDSETSLQKIIHKIPDVLAHIENWKEKLENKTVDLQRILEENEGLEGQVKGLEEKVISLCSQNREYEEKIRSKNQEANQLREEKEESEKQRMEKVEELSALQEKTEINILKKQLGSLETKKNQMDSRNEIEKKNLLERLTQIEKRNIELTSKIAENQTTLQGRDDVINELNKEITRSKLSFQIAEKKIEDNLDEFRKNIEDSLRILSRRIRVAEQLHLENKDVYFNTKEKYEQANTNLKQKVVTTEEAVKKMKEISLTVNSTLAGLDSVALKFEECSGNIMNRISKTSCEVLFAKDWMRRKSNAIKHVQEDIDTLLVQLDTKEGEILELREKVWKWEHKARDLEKTVTEREERLLVMEEEKREAIRQLCVWIDYHRSRGDYLKKVLHDVIASRSQRAT